MKIVFHPSVVEDFISIQRYYQTIDQDLAKELEGEIRLGYEKIKMNPTIYPLYGIHEMRKYHLKKFPIRFCIDILKKALSLYAFGIMQGIQS